MSVILFSKEEVSQELANSYEGLKDLPRPYHEIDGFSELRGINNSGNTHIKNMHSFLSAWGSLQYNCYTNDGEQYIAKEG